MVLLTNSWRCWHSSCLSHYSYRAARTSQCLWGWRLHMGLNFGTDGLWNCLMKYVAGAAGQSIIGKWWVCCVYWPSLYCNKLLLAQLRDTTSTLLWSWQWHLYFLLRPWIKRGLLMPRQCIGCTVFYGWWRIQHVLVIYVPRKFSAIASQYFVITQTVITSPTKRNLL